jgi:hypothetical protein
MDYAWTCQCCGKQFNTLPLDFAVNAPDHWFEIPDSERENRGRLTSDICIIDGKNKFVRGCLEVPIIDHDDIFVWGVWVSVSAKSFDHLHELWDADVIENEPPMFGWLCNNISIYPATMSLKTHLYPRAGSERPLIELEPTDHPLAVEQRTGIMLDRVQEIVAALFPRH